MEQRRTWRSKDSEFMSCDTFFVGYRELKIFPGINFPLPECVLIVTLQEGGILAGMCNTDNVQDYNRIETETSGAPP